MAVTKNTVVSVSIGTLLTLAAPIWFGVTKVQGAVSQIEQNTKSVKVIVTSLELIRIDNQIDALQRERREINRQLRKDPDNDLLLKQQDEINDELHALENLRDCIVDPDKEVCK